MHYTGANDLDKINEKYRLAESLSGDLDRAHLYFWGLVAVYAVLLYVNPLPHLFFSPARDSYYLLTFAFLVIVFLFIQLAIANRIAYVTCLKNLELQREVVRIKESLSRPFRKEIPGRRNRIRFFEIFSKHFFILLLFVFTGSLVAALAYRYAAAPWGEADSVRLFFSLLVLQLALVRFQLRERN